MAKENPKNKNLVPNSPSMGFVMLSKMVTEGGKEIGFLYREKPLNPYDSGWRIFYGKEPNEYTQKQSNFEVCDSSKVLKIDKSLRKVLAGPIGSAFSKKRRGKWVKAKNFKSPDDYLALKKIGKDWTMKINNLFTERVEPDKSITYTQKGKSVRVSLWKFDDKEPQEVYEYHKEHLEKLAKEGEPALESFDDQEQDIRKIGAMFKDSEYGKVYKVIYGFSIKGSKVLQTNFYFDSAADKKWALETWKTINFIGE